MPSGHVAIVVGPACIRHCNYNAIMLLRAVAINFINSIPCVR